MSTEINVKGYLFLSNGENLSIGSHTFILIFLFKTFMKFEKFKNFNDVNQEQKCKINFSNIILPHISTKKIKTDLDYYFYRRICLSKLNFINSMSSHK